MTDHAVMLIASPSGWLALDRDQFDRALERGARLVPSSNNGTNTPLVNAMNTGMNTGTTKALFSSRQMQDATGVPASWFERQARERRIPSIKLGRYVRFSLEDVGACEAYRRHAVPDDAVLAKSAGHHNRSNTKT